MKKAKAEWMRDNDGHTIRPAGDHTGSHDYVAYIEVRLPSRKNWQREATFAVEELLEKLEDYDA